MTTQPAARKRARTRTSESTPQAATHTSSPGRRAVEPSTGADFHPVLRAYLRVHPRGFAFADPQLTSETPSRGGRLSVFVPPNLVGDMMSDDLVDVCVGPESTASSITLVERRRQELFGVVESGGLLRGDPHVTHAKLKLSGAARPGTAVRTELTTTGARVVETFDDPISEPALRARALCRYEVPSSIPAGAEDFQLPRTSTQQPRRDLRDLVTFTIDADSSQDLDDALSVLPAGPDGALRVYIHIADVAEHVLVNTPVDDFARLTATSVYLPEWNRPMLPRRLSEQALSLLPGVDRDALTAELRITPDGDVTAVDIFETRIRSNARLSYDTAALVLAGVEPGDTDHDLVTTLRWLRTAAARLALQRARRGGVTSNRFEPELSVGLADDKLTASRLNEAHTLIERLMVATNEAVDVWMTARGLLALHRRHDIPGPDASQELELFAGHLGFYPGFSSTLTPLALAAFDIQLQQSDARRASSIWDILLKHLGRARYSPEPGGHFGLGSPGYLHFTSPIRRYADLTVHRTIKAYLAGARDPGEFQSFAELTALADHINDATRRAARAEADCRKALWLAELQSQIGTKSRKRFTGRVTGIQNRGVFVTLEGSLVTGMVSFRSLPGGPWRTVPHAALGANGKRIEVGTALTVVVDKIDIEAGMLDLRAPGTRTPSARTTGTRPSQSRSSSTTPPSTSSKAAHSTPAASAPSASAPSQPRVDNRNPKGSKPSTTVNAAASQKRPASNKSRRPKPSSKNTAQKTTGKTPSAKQSSAKTSSTKSSSTKPANSTSRKRSPRPSANTTGTHTRQAAQPTAENPQQSTPTSPNAPRSRRRRRRPSAPS